MLKRTKKTAEKAAPRERVTRKDVEDDGLDSESISLNDSQAWSDTEFAEDDDAIAERRRDPLRNRV
jgi:hypothetical protein